LFSGKNPEENNMSIAQSLLPEFDQETENTRKVLSRVPDGKFDYKPHPKSGTLGWLSGHVAGVLGWGKEVLTLTELDLSPDGKPFVPPPVPANNKELMEHFEKCAAAARAGLAAASDADMMVEWKLLMNKQQIFAMPRIACYRGMVMNHMIHHRGQLEVYLRLLDVPLPAIYGPSADEGKF
jgi:uncharacterized damage-inducible protein DinB